MTFDYYSLKRVAQSGDKIGNWNGKPVFSCSSADLENKGSGAYYLLYDDENKIVTKDGKFYYSYGTVSESGSVTEYNSRRRYNVACETQHDHGDYKTPVSPSGTYSPGYDVSERPVADVKVEIDVEATLKKAREMSVDDLLDGFMASVMAVG